MLQHMTEFPYFLGWKISHHLYIYHILLIHSSTSRHQGRFHLLAVVNNSAVNMCVQIPLRDPAFNYFGSTLRSGIAGSYSNFKFLRKLNIHFPQRLHLFTEEIIVSP